MFWLIQQTFLDSLLYAKHQLNTDHLWVDTEEELCPFNPLLIDPTTVLLRNTPKWWEWGNGNKPYNKNWSDVPFCFVPKFGLRNFKRDVKNLNKIQKKS